MINTKTLLGWVVTILTVLIISVMVFQNSDYYQKIKDSQKENWQWGNEWGNEKQDQPIQPKKPDKPETPIQGQIKAESFEQAKSLSSQHDRPILIIFTAKWCQWCKKLKDETLQDANVQKSMQRYILVSIDTDVDRSVADKFNVKSLPTIVITNAQEQKLKSNSGFMKSSDMVRWLDEPKK